MGDSATYRLPHQLVARVTRTVTQRETALRETTLAAWLLHTAHISVVEPAEEPVELNDTVVTFWHELTSHRPATPAEIGHFLRDLHTITSPKGELLTPLRPFVRIAERINTAPIPAGDKTFLCDRLRNLENRWRTATFTLGPAVIHGDPHDNNIVAIDDGRILALDLERVAIGPPEWDLTLVASEHDSFGWVSTAAYQQFADAYGFDVLSSPSYELLRDIRELRMTSWLANRADQNDQIANETQYRINCLRGHNGPRPWNWTAS
ncbi:aminoglycoside phosphotransferase family protein [Saccharopolyspora sp. NPDC050389]|uniref:aminoglycoside phosphotransferase family protein n=1 Tax=Saccharopolyspora sp. NPDC050389 TaxID=3155516 RepID=UPI0033EF310A